MSNLIPIADVLFDADVFTDGDWVETKDQDPEGNVRLTQLADVGDGKWINKSARFLTSEKAKQLRCTYLRSGDVLVARMPDPLGRCCVFPGDLMPCVTVVDVCVIRPNQHRVDNRYLMHAINAPHGRRGIARHVTGTTRRRISRKNLGKVEIPLPSPAEQKRIAEILDAADALRAKRREALAQLDTLIQSTFIDMFGDPVTNPMGLEQKPLGEVIRVKSGNGLVSKDLAPDGKYPVYGGNGINGYHNSFMFEEPRIVLGRVGVYCGIVHLTRERAWVTDNALYVHTFIQPIDTTYLVAALKMANLNQYAGRSAQPLISGKRIYPVEILIPPVDLQRRFATIVESIEQQMASQRAHFAELDTLFASLQCRAFRGDL